MPAVLLGVAAALAWSVHDVIVRSLASRVGPFRMAALVMIVGGLMLTAIVWVTGGLSALRGDGIVSALLMGLAYGLGAGGLFKAFHLAPMSVVAPITAVYPALVVMWGLANGLAPTPLQWLAVAATIAGGIVVARSGHKDGGLNVVPKEVWPALFFFSALSMLGYAAAVVLGQAGAVQMGEIETAWLSRPTALAALLPFLLTEPRGAPLTRTHWLGIAAMSLADICGVIAVNASGHAADKDFAALGISAYGVIAVLLGHVLLKESVSRGQWAGILMIVAGVAVLSAAG